MPTDLTTPAEQIVAVIRDIRARYTNGDELTARILTGDDDALAEGQRVHSEVIEAARALEPFGFDDTCAVESMFGVTKVVDAVLVAIGEQSSDDDEVHERFKAVRLERLRTSYEAMLARVEGDDSRAADDLRRQLRSDLELVTAGVEPTL